VKKVVIGLVLSAAMAVPAMAQERVTLWRDIQAGMSKEEVRAKYTKKERDRSAEGWYWGGATVLESRSLSEKCDVSVTILHDGGPVSEVTLTGNTAYNREANCDQSALASLITKYGEPVAEAEIVESTTRYNRWSNTINTDVDRDPIYKFRDGALQIIMRINGDSYSITYSVAPKVEDMRDGL